MRGRPRLTTEIFIERANQIHRDKYDYSEVDYVNNHTKVKIVCPVHGEFWQTPNEHLKGCDCPKCAGVAKLTNAEFIEKAKRIHGDKYDYSKVNYINSYTKVEIICPEHGSFWQCPNNHIHQKQGCPKCNKGRQRLTTEIFIERAKQLHGDKYDYSKVEYKGAVDKVLIHCNECGADFWQTPTQHLRTQCPCPKCRESNKTPLYKNEEEFKQRHVECQTAYVKRLKWKNPEQYEKVLERHRKRYEKIKADPVLYEQHKAYQREYNKKYRAKQKRQKKLNNEILELTSQLEMI